MGSAWQTLTTGWSFEPQIIVGIFIACLLYWRGFRWSKQRGLRHALEWWRPWVFAAAALSAFVALVSPIDSWADTYFWSHMLQHELLIFVTAPLALLSAPWMPMWRGLPLAWRRGVLRPLARRGVIHKLNRVAQVVGSPIFAWFFFAVTLSFWHLPVMYDLTEQYVAIHYTEHALFLIAALLFWGQVIPSFPFRPSLSQGMQIAFLFAATLQGNLLDWFMMSATTPIYPYYAAIRRTPDMVSAVVDQHLAAGIMMVASLASFVVVLIVIAGLWLADDERRTAEMDAQIAAAMNTQPH